MNFGASSIQGGKGSKGLTDWDVDHFEPVSMLLDGDIWIVVGIGNLLPTGLSVYDNSLRECRVRLTVHEKRHRGQCSSLTSSAHQSSHMSMQGTFTS